MINPGKFSREKSREPRSGKSTRDKSRENQSLFLHNTGSKAIAKTKGESIKLNQLGNNEEVLGAILTGEMANHHRDHNRGLSISWSGGEAKIDPEDLRLLNNFSRGDESSFWQLWSRHQKHLYGCCLELMKGNRWEAEEALSEATIKAWDKLPKYAEKITNIKGWLTRLTLNICLEMHRQRKRRAQKVESIEAMAVADNEAIASNLDSPDDAILRREMAAHIRCAIETLPSRLSEPFILRFCQEKSYPAIAKQLGLSESNVRKCIQQARAILQEQLNRYLLGSDNSPCLPDSSAPLPKEVEPKEVGNLSPDLKSNQPAIGDREVPATQTAVLFYEERISYRVTASCLEALPHIRSPLMGSLGWR
ncbi:MAG: RNA polymerase sigma factor [Oscillatoria sp. SIO1A7]|nr:RNA polymerase sigma factor [Oscillatoria sp. SIO1A7]